MFIPVTKFNVATLRIKKIFTLFLTSTYTTVPITGRQCTFSVSFVVMYWIHKIFRKFFNKQKKLFNKLIVDIICLIWKSYYVVLQPTMSVGWFACSKGAGGHTTQFTSILNKCTTSQIVTTSHSKIPFNYSLFLTRAVTQWLVIF